MRFALKLLAVGRWHGPWSRGHLAFCGLVLAPGVEPSGAATLHVATTGAVRGNTAERILIGFGVGQSKLQASAAVETEY
jgi:hypothetical protein